jgi:cytoskeletal protein RodZ
MPSLGDEFRAAREARHLSLSDVSKQIHVRSVYLQSIEDEDWTSIAAPVYVRGFIRTYARFLGLDPDEGVRRYNQLLGDAATTAPGPLSYARPRSSGPSIGVWVAGIAALILIAFVGYSYYLFEAENGGAQRADQARATAPPATVSTASPEMAATTAPAMVPTVLPKPSSSASSNTLVIRIRQDSWLEVSVDGTQKLSQMVPAGTEKSFHGKSVTVRAGNAGGVDAVVDGKDLGILGAAGDVVDRTFKL